MEITCQGCSSTVSKERVPWVLRWADVTMVLILFWGRKGGYERDRVQSRVADQLRKDPKIFGIVFSGFPPLQAAVGIVVRRVQSQQTDKPTSFGACFASCMPILSLLRLGHSILATLIVKRSDKATESTNKVNYNEDDEPFLSHWNGRGCRQDPFTWHLGTMMQSILGIADSDFCFGATRCLNLWLPRVENQEDFLRFKNSKTLLNSNASKISFWYCFFFFTIHQQIGLNFDHDTAEGSLGAAVPKMTWASEETSVGDMFDVQVRWVESDFFPRKSHARTKFGCEFLTQYCRLYFCWCFGVL